MATTTDPTMTHEIVGSAGGFLAVCSCGEAVDDFPRHRMRAVIDSVLSRAIQTARDTEKAGAWSDHDRLVALGALDGLNANILAGLITDALTEVSR